MDIEVVAPKLDAGGSEREGDFDDQAGLGGQDPGVGADIGRRFLSGEDDAAGRETVRADRLR